MPEIKALCQIIKNYGNSVSDLNPPADMRSIIRFQEENSIILPSDYVTLLTEFDGGHLFKPGTRIFGLFCEAPGNIVRINGKDYRRALNLPKDQLIIGKLNYGDYICIGLNVPFSIAQWDHETDSQFCSWPSLADWLAGEIDNYERYIKADINE